MNDIFSLNRFGLYICQFFGENKKKILTMTAAIIGCMIFVAAVFPALNGTYNIPYTDYDPMPDNEILVFWIMIFAFCAGCAGDAFKSYGNRNRRFALLTLPSSTLEKYLTYFLFFILYPLAICLFGVIIADCIRVWTIPLYAGNDAYIEYLSLKGFLTLGSDNFYNSQFDSLERIQRIQFSIVQGWMGLMIIQSFFFLAASIWPKHGRVRGILCGIGLIITYFILSVIGTGIVISSNIIEVNVEKYGPSFNLFLTLSCITATITILANYSIAYLRYRELETIDRW